jgi:hypothetical protein
MSPGLPILYICAIGGFLIIAASFFLLWKRRIFLDRTTKEVTEIELPMGIKAKSQAPVILLILIGGVLMMFSVVEAQKFAEEITVNGQVNGSHTSVELYASVASQAVPHGGKFSLPLPVTHPSRTYTVLYAVDGTVIDSRLFDPAASSTKELGEVIIDIPATPELKGKIDPKPPEY